MYDFEGKNLTVPNNQNLGRKEDLQETNHHRIQETEEEDLLHMTEEDRGKTLLLILRTETGEEENHQNHHKDIEKTHIPLLHTDIGERILPSRTEIDKGQVTVKGTQKKTEGVTLTVRAQTETERKGLRKGQRTLKALKSSEIQTENVLLREIQ